MSTVTPAPSDEMGRFAFDGAEGIAFWIYDDASQKTAESKIMLNELSVLLSFLQHNFPGLFPSPSSAESDAVAREMARHWYVAQGQCACGHPYSSYGTPGGIDPGEIARHTSDAVAAVGSTSEGSQP